MKTMEQIASEKNSEAVVVNPYDDMIQRLTEAKEADMPIEEGIMGAIVGGLAGMTIAPTIMKAVCKILGIDPKGQFGNLMTSRLVLTALGVELGLNK